jgi:hypothetical protein
MTWQESIPFLCPSELEQDEPFPHAGEIMWQQNRGMDFTPSSDTMELVKGVLSNELSYIQDSGHPNENDLRLLQELLDENIDNRSVPNWQKQVSRRIKAVAWRFRIQEAFLQAAVVLAQQGLIEPDFKTALTEPIDVAGYDTHPSAHAVETALRRFGKAWRVLCINCFPEEYRFRRHLASPYPYPFSWLSTIIARSAKTNQTEPILKVLERSQLLGPLEELSPPQYDADAWQRFAATGRPPSPPGAPARLLDGRGVKLIETVFEPAKEFVIDPKAGEFPPEDPRAQGGRYRNPALNFWLPSAGMGGSGDKFATEVRKYAADLWERRSLMRIAFEAWFGEGKWGSHEDADDAVCNFVEAAMDGYEGDGDVNGYDGDDEEMEVTRDEQGDDNDNAENETTDDDSERVEPFPPYPYDDWEFVTDSDDLDSSDYDEDDTDDNEDDYEDITGEANDAHDDDNEDGWVFFLRFLFSD